MTCPRCGAVLHEGSRFCASCGVSVSASGVTVTEDPAARYARTPSHPSSGWLTSSDSIDHGRFAPGAILDGRYRIIGLIGRGGMGEVFRADDLRLGQPVALKFLPPDLGRDPQRLAQLHNEVRTARQVSHPNVCRVYDVGEVDGEIYLTMEYVDGENLAASLKRVGRFPEDRAVAIAREMCAGLAAAHDRGVIHRDLKPANIMIDAAGRVRLMDFGLAASGSVDNIRAGTPAFMSPEQIEGREVTSKSDIYALGLVLYELFTARPAFSAATLADLILQRASGELTPPTELVKGLDPAIERVILRCLEQSPTRRPASALLVSAELPGGDPLAAAVAAGETPSPAMVAAAGGEGAMLTAAQGAALTATLIALLWLTAWLSDRSTVPGLTNMRKPASVLAEYGRQARAAAGYLDVPRYEAFGLVYDQGVMRWYAAYAGQAERWRRLDQGRVPAAWFWFRTSTLPLDPLNPLQNTERNDPPRHLRSGDSVVDLATDGRLRRLFVVPPRTGGDTSAPMTAPDWAPLFSAAGLRFPDFTPAASQIRPPSDADQRFAWIGNVEGFPEMPFRVEASAAAGRPISFEVIGPWETASPFSRFAWLVPHLALIAAVLRATMLMIVIFLAIANARAARVDRRSAWRIAIVMFTALILTWAGGYHASAPLAELDRFFAHLGLALFRAAAFAAAFIGIEPYVRRYFPQALVGATRLLRGPRSDAVVGRDVLLGLTSGVLIAVVVLSYVGLPRLLNFPSPAPHRPFVYPMTSPAGTIALALRLEEPFVNSFAAMILVALFRRYLTSRWAAIVCSAVVLTLIDNPALMNFHGNQLQLLGLGFVTVLLTVVVFVRYGLLAGMSANYARFLLESAFTLDSSRAYFHSSIVIATIIVTLGVIGWRMSRGNEPMFSAGVPDPAR